MPRRSAGILPFRHRGGNLEVLLVHPGGPFWRNRDEGAWSIVKGELAPDETPEAAARREFAEETGWTLEGELIPLGEVRQAGGKVVTGFAVAADYDPETLCSNTFDMEWPPRSGQIRASPEIDGAHWFLAAQAEEKLIPAQRQFLSRLQTAINDFNIK